MTSRSVSLYGPAKRCRERRGVRRLWGILATDSVGDTKGRASKQATASPEHRPYTQARPERYPWSARPSRRTRERPRRDTRAPEASGGGKQVYARRAPTLRPTRGLQAPPIPKAPLDGMVCGSPEQPIRPTTVKAGALGKQGSNKAS